MKKKCFFIIILFLMFLQNINSETNERNINDFSIAIGGGFNNSLSIERIAYGIGNNIKIVIPFSFTYYPKNFFGIGFTYSPGLNFVLSGRTLLIPRFIDFTNEFNVINKFGRINKLYLLLEYGVSLIGRFSLTEILNEYQNYNIYHKNHLLCGPNLLTGFEIKTKKNFLFTFGGTLQFLFGSIEIYSPDTTTRSNPLRQITISEDNWTKNFEYDISFGIECRWRFYYQKKFD